VWTVSDTTDNDRESICGTVCHTVTLPRTVRQRYVHHSQCNFGVLRQLTPAANYPSAARPTTPAVRSVGARYHSVHQLAHRLLQPLSTTVNKMRNAESQPSRYSSAATRDVKFLYFLNSTFVYVLDRRTHVTKSKAFTHGSYISYYKHHMKL